MLVHTFGEELLGREAGSELGARDSRKVDPLCLPVPLLAEREDELARPDARADLRVQAGLFRKLALQRVLIGLVAGKPVLLFRGRYRFGGLGVPGYDVTNDGRRFLMVKPSDDELAPRRLHVVLNWADELARRVPSGLRR